MVPPTTVAPDMVPPNMVAPNSRFKFFGHIHKFKIRTLVESVASLHSLLVSKIKNEKSKIKNKAEARVASWQFSPFFLKLGSLISPKLSTFIVHLKLLYNV